MKIRRGKDPDWEVRRYLGDIALYAKCKCGFEYDCGGQPDENFKIHATNIYTYCPSCGARKYRYNPEPLRLNYYRW